MQLNRNGTKNLSSMKEGEVGILVVIGRDAMYILYYQTQSPSH